MPDPANKRHALTAFLGALPVPTTGDPQVLVEVRPRLAHLNLRGPTGNGAFLQAVATVLGQSLPCGPNTCSAHPNHVFWLGPDEWLIVADSDRGPAMLQALRTAVIAEHAAVTDLTGGQIALRLSGSGACDVLAQGCTIDLHPRAFLPGHCAQTNLAKAVVLIARLSEEPVIDLVVRRSFAQYVALWLQQAGRDYVLRFAESNPPPLSEG